MSNLHLPPQRTRPSSLLHLPHKTRLECIDGRKFSHEKIQVARPVLRTHGSVALETALYLPILFLLLFGTMELAKITYTYYTLQKILSAVARYAGTQQGANFCDAADPAITAATQFAISASLDTSANSLVQNLTADMIQVRAERIDPNTGDLNQCTCSPTGCDAASGGLPPDFIVVSIPSGYPFAPHIPFIPTDPILLRPTVRVPYGGT